MKKIKIILRISFLLVFCFGPFSIQAVDSWPAEDGVTVATYSEPSGIIWNSDRDSLFIVQDPPNSNVIELDEEGNTLNTWYIGGDLEGITIAEGEIYLAREYPQAILKFDITSGTVTETNDISATMPGNSSSGMEALTYVPGVGFYAGSQYNGKIYVFDDSFDFVETITPSADYSSDISGLHYNYETQTIFAIYDSYNVLLELDTSGTILNSYSLPGNSQEGIALKEFCPEAQTTLYIAQDSGAVKSYDQWPVDNSSCEVDSGDDEDDGDPGDEGDERGDDEDDGDNGQDNDDELGDDGGDSDDDQDEIVKQVVGVEGLKNGNILINYDDDSTVKFDLFDITTEKLTKIEKYKKTDKYIILHPKGKELVMFEAGNILDSQNLVKHNYQYANFKIKELRDKNWAVITLKNKKNQARLFIVKILPAQNKFGLEKSIKKFKTKNLKVIKTKKNKNTLQLRSNKKIIRKYLVAKKYNLKRK